MDEPPTRRIDGCYFVSTENDRRTYTTIMRIQQDKVDKKAINLAKELDSLWGLNGGLLGKSRKPYLVRSRVAYCYIASLELKKYDINNTHIMGAINCDHSINTHYSSIMNNYIESGNIPEDVLNYLVMFYSKGNKKNIPQWVDFFKYKLKKTSKLSEMQNQIQEMQEDRLQWSKLDTSSLSGFLKAKYSELLNVSDDSLERIKTALEQKIRFEVATAV